MPARPEHDILFNFAASPVGGGLKRLEEYARWFDAHGGARFVVHPRCGPLREHFPRNEFLVAEQSSASRIVRGLRIVDQIRKERPIPRCYYAYGVPLSARVGRVNWFHLSNVLPLVWRTVPLPLQMRLRFRILGGQIRRGLRHADVISAESQASLSLFGPTDRSRLFESVNGSDDELAEIQRTPFASPEPRVVVVGTYPYKDLDESVRIFDALKRQNPALKLVIYGDRTLVPPSAAGRADVEVRGDCPRSQVVDTLRRAKYYLSTTLIENSYNAAAEGMFLAQQSFVSDIGPHRELLAPLPHQRITFEGATRPLLAVKRSELSAGTLKSWAQVIAEMNARIEQELQAVSGVEAHGG